MSGKKHEEHENHERWVIPYADMVTLLFAFFVVMYSMSMQDLAKLKKVSASVQEAFMGHPKGGARNAKVDIGMQKGQPQAQPKIISRRTTNSEIIDELKKQLTVDGFDFIYQDDVSPIQVTIDQRGVVISVSSGFLFEDGSVEIKPELYPVIGVIAQIMGESKRLILVEGHTDNQYAYGNLYESNWELSVLRATAMVRVLTEEFHVDPTRLTASGYAHYRPLGDNNTKKGREQNRRVEIVLLNASKPEDLLEDPSIPR